VSEGREQPRIERRTHCSKELRRVPVEELRQLTTCAPPLPPAEGGSPAQLVPAKFGSFSHASSGNQSLGSGSSQTSARACPDLGAAQAHRRGARCSQRRAAQELHRLAGEHLCQHHGTRPRAQADAANGAGAGHGGWCRRGGRRRRPAWARAPQSARPTARGQATAASVSVGPLGQRGQRHGAGLKWEQGRRGWQGGGAHGVPSREETEQTEAMSEEETEAF